MKKRLLSIFLALSMLLALAVLFAACGKSDGHVRLKGDAEVDVKGYAFVYADSAAKTSTYRNTMTGLASTLSDVTGERFAARLAGAAKISEADPAILIGDTGQKETTKLLESISGDGFAIEVFDNRIAIVGSNDLMTLYAVNYFAEKFLKQQSGGSTLTIPKKAVAEDLPMVTLATPEKSETTFIYADGLYTSKRHPVDLLVGVYAARDLRDTPVSVTDDLIGAISSATGLGKTKFKIKTDKEESGTTEFLVSKTNRPVSADCLQSLNVAEYGFFVENGQFVMTAWNDGGLLAAQADFADLLKEAGATGGKSKITVAFPEGFFYKNSINKNWNLDFPMPDGVSLYSSMDTGDDSVQLVYMGEGVGAEAHRNYVTKLQDAGYELLMENTIKDSLFATLVNKETENMLYVSYNAFAHEKDYAHSYEPLMRVVSSPTKSVAVPDTTLLSKQPYTKICNTSVTAIELVGNAVGMGYIVTLEDGSFILFDGGNPAAREDADIWELLLARYRQTHGGKDPTSADPIRVAAWVVTHSHGDHYSVFRKFLSNYGRRSDFKMDYLIGNFPSPSSVNCVYNSDIGMMGDGAIASLQNIVDFTFLKVHSGQKYYFANLEMEVLMTYDDLAPAQIKNQNDTSTVLRFTLQATKDGIDESGAVTDVGSPYTMIWTGDANNQQSRYMCAMYGDYLKSDMVQLAHHGNIGCESDFYDAVGASVVWFPNTLNSYRNYLNPNSKDSNWVHKVDWRLINESEDTKYVFVSGAADDTGAKIGINLTLPFGNDGQPAFDDIYNTLEGTNAKLEYVKNTVTGGVAIKPPHNWN